jgi:hypothetical protein
MNIKFIYALLSLFMVILLSAPMTHAYNYGNWNFNYLNDEPNRDDEDEEDEEDDEEDEKKEEIYEIITIGTNYGGYIPGFTMVGPNFNFNTNPSSGSPSQSNSLEAKKKQCIDSCLESFGDYYEVAAFLSPWSSWGVGLFIATETYEAFGEPNLRRHAIRQQNYGNFRWGQRLLRGIKLFARFNAVSTIASLTGLGAQGAMNLYCSQYQCSDSKLRGNRSGLRRRR